MNVLVNEDKEVDNKILKSYKAANDYKLPEIKAKKDKFEDDQDIDQKPTEGEDDEYTKQD